MPVKSLQAALQTSTRMRPVAYWNPPPVLRHAPSDSPPLPAPDLAPGVRLWVLFPASLQVQAILEELLPSLRGHMHELSDEVVPHLLEKMKPGQADALADAIRATQQMFIDEENSKKAAAAAAYLKTRAGRRAAILEMAIVRTCEGGGAMPFGPKLAHRSCAAV